MSDLAFKAYWKLLRFDWYLLRRNFTALYNQVRNCPVNPGVPEPNALGNICSAVDSACTWYWKGVLCLQRSAVLTCLLRERGVPAEMVIGVQQAPFRAHAWAEVNGNVVSDRPSAVERWAVLDRC